MHIVCTVWAKEWREREEGSTIGEVGCEGRHLRAVGKQLCGVILGCPHVPVQDGAIPAASGEQMATPSHSAHPPAVTNQSANPAKGATVNS